MRNLADTGWKLFISLIILGLTACGEGPSDPASSPLKSTKSAPLAAPQGLVIEASHLSLAPGGSTQLSAWILEQDNSRSKIETGVDWQISRGDDIAGIDQSGLLTVNDDGAGEIEVTASYSLQRNDEQLQFEQRRAFTAAIAPTAVRIDVFSGELYESESAQFVVMVEINQVSQRATAPVDWTVTPVDEPGKTGSATIDATGRVTAERAGRVRITASMGGVVSSAVEVRIHPRLQGVALQTGHLDLAAGNAVPLIAYGLDRFGQRYDEQNIAHLFRWASGDVDSLSDGVENGEQVTAFVGDSPLWPVTLTATHKQRAGLKSSLKVGSVSQLRNQPQQLELATGESSEIGVDAILENGENSSDVTDWVSCNSSDANQLTVTPECLVTAIQAGEARVDSQPKDATESGIAHLPGDSTLVKVFQHLPASATPTIINGNTVYRMTGLMPGSMYHVRLDSLAISSGAGLSVRRSADVISPETLYCQHTSMQSGSSYYCNLHAVDEFAYIELLDTASAQAELSLHFNAHVRSAPFTVRSGNGLTPSLFTLQGATAGERLNIVANGLPAQVHLAVGDTTRRVGGDSDPRGLLEVDPDCLNYPPTGYQFAACEGISGAQGLYVGVNMLHAMSISVPVQLSIRAGQFAPTGTAAQPAGLLRDETRSDTVAVYGLDVSELAGHSFYTFDNTDCPSESTSVVTVRLDNISALPGSSSEFVRLGVVIGGIANEGLDQGVNNASSSSLAVSSARYLPAGRLVPITVKGLDSSMDLLTGALLGGASYNIHLTATCQ